MCLFWKLVTRYQGIEDQPFHLLMFTGMTTMGFEPPRAGLSFMNLWPSLKESHHCTVLKVTCKIQIRLMPNSQEKNPGLTPLVLIESIYNKLHYCNHDQNKGNTVSNQLFTVFTVQLFVVFTHASKSYQKKKKNLFHSVHNLSFSIRFKKKIWKILTTSDQYRLKRQTLNITKCIKNLLKSYYCIIM